MDQLILGSGSFGKKFAPAIDLGENDGMKHLVAAVTLSLALAACASTKKVVEQEPRDPDPAYYVARAEAMDTMQKNFERVHFAFDSTSITDESRDALAANVEIMRRFHDLGVEVEGHC